MEADSRPNNVLFVLFAQCQDAAADLRRRLAGDVPISVSVPEGAMRPYLYPGDVLKVRRAEAADLGGGDLVYCTVGGQERVMRFLSRGSHAELVVASEREDEQELRIGASALIGRVHGVKRHGRSVRPRGVGILTA